MADIPGALVKMNDIEVAADAPHSEVIWQKTGANVNGLIDSTISQDATLVSNLARLTALEAKEVIEPLTDPLVNVAVGTGGLGRTLLYSAPGPEYLQFIKIKLKSSPNHVPTIQYYQYRVTFGFGSLSGVNPNAGLIGDFTIGDINPSIGSDALFSFAYSGDQECYYQLFNQGTGGAFVTMQAHRTLFPTSSRAFTLI